MQDLQQIAQVLKSNGADGELILGFRHIAPEDIDVKEPVFICFDGLPVPFFIESFIRKGQSKALVRLTGINSADDALEVVGQGVYAESGSLDVPVDDDDFSMLAGWTLLDADGTEVGEIADYLDIPGNPCIEVTLKKESSRDGNGEVIIPLHEDLILSVDAQKRELVMSVPAGLL